MSDPGSPTIAEFEGQVDVAIDALGLDASQEQVLRHIAKRRTHLLIGEAPAELSAALSLPIADCVQLLNVLIAGELLHFEPSTGRVSASYDRLGVSDVMRDAYLTLPTTYRTVGAPDSVEAVEGLRAIFAEPQPVFLCFEVTGTPHYPDLNTRTESAPRTIVLIPKRKDVTAGNDQFYARALEGWKDYLGTTPAARGYVQLREMAHPHRAIYGAVLSKNSVRLNLWQYDGDVRHGDLTP